MKNLDYIVFNPINSSLNYYPIHKVVKAKLNYLNEIEYVYELDVIKSHYKFNNINNINEYNRLIKIITKKEEDCFKK